MKPYIMNIQKLHIFPVIHFGLTLWVRNQYWEKLRPSTMFRAISMCLWTTMNKRDYLPQPLETLANASSTTFTSRFIY